MSKQWCGALFIGLWLLGAWSQAWAMCQVRVQEQREGYEAFLFAWEDAPGRLKVFHTHYRRRLLLWEGKGGRLHSHEDLPLLSRGELVKKYSLVDRPQRRYEIVSLGSCPRLLQSLIAFAMEESFER